jgi:hypothetical protein
MLELLPYKATLVHALHPSGQKDEFLKLVFEVSLLCRSLRMFPPIIIGTGELLIRI